jgi:hypothetical protein
MAYQHFEVHPRQRFDSAKFWKKRMKETCLLKCLPLIDLENGTIKHIYLRPMKQLQHSSESQLLAKP